MNQPAFMNQPVRASADVWGQAATDCVSNQAVKGTGMTNLVYAVVKPVDYVGQKAAGVCAGFAKVQSETEGLEKIVQFCLHSFRLVDLLRANVSEVSANFQASLMRIDDFFEITRFFTQDINYVFYGGLSKDLTPQEKDLDLLKGDSIASKKLAAYAGVSFLVADTIVTTRSVYSMGFSLGPFLGNLANTFGVTRLFSGASYSFVGLCAVATAFAFDLAHLCKRLIHEDVENSCKEFLQVKIVSRVCDLVQKTLTITGRFNPYSHAALGWVSSGTAMIAMARS